MKTKNITILLVAVFFYACHKDKIIEPEVFNFDCSRYPVTGYFKDYEQDPNPHGIPENILDTISTEGLLLSCLYSPSFLGILLYSDGAILQHAYSLLEKNSYMSMLLEKENAHLYIYERYLCAGVGDFGFFMERRYFYLEFFLLYPPILSKYNETEKMDILGRAIETYENLFLTNEWYSMTSASLAAKILNSFNYKPFLDFLDNIERSHFFFDFGSLAFMSDNELDMVIEYAKEFINNN